MSRFLGVQRGGLQKTKNRVPKWSATWYAYRPDGSRRRRVKVIGIVSEMTEAKARSMLRELIAADNRIATGVFAEKTGIIPRTVKRGDLADTTMVKGAMAEMAVAMDLMLKGWDVFRPVSVTATCDLIGVKGPDTIRFEVKSASVVGISNPRFRCDLRRNLGKFDVVAICVFATGEIHYIQKDDVQGHAKRPPVSLSTSSYEVGKYEAEASEVMQPQAL